MISCWRAHAGHDSSRKETRLSILAVTSQVPWPLHTGGHLRSYHILTFLCEKALGGPETLKAKDLRSKGCGAAGFREVRNSPSYTGLIVMTYRGVTKMKMQDLVRVRCPICSSLESRFERSLNGFTLEKCQCCGLVFTNPQYTPEALSLIYTRRDTARLEDLYARIASPSILSEYQETLDFLERRLPGRGRLLDFACAAGYFFELAGKRGWEAHGVDIGEWTLAVARARGLKNLHVGNLRDLRFPDQYFDVVYAAQVLEHLHDPRKELMEMRRILRPGGILYVDVPNYRTLPNMLGKDDFLLNMPPQHINYFTPRTLNTLLEAVGFRAIRIRSSSGLKWENLFGKPIRSDILKAYGLGGYKNGDPTGSSKAVSRWGVAKRLKKTLTACLVTPIFYRALKVGMLLIGDARNPEL